jgi:hypothetical protein
MKPDCCRGAIESGSDRHRWQHKLTQMPAAFADEWSKHLRSIIKYGHWFESAGSSHLYPDVQREILRHSPLTREYFS